MDRGPKRLTREVETPASARSRWQGLAMVMLASALLVSVSLLARSSPDPDRATRDEPPLVTARYWVEPGCHCWAEDYIVLEEPGRPARRVDVPAATRANLRAGTLDLDGDGADEIVAVIHEGTSNGIAIAHYHAVIFDGRDRTTQVGLSTIGWGVAADVEPAEPFSPPPLDGLFLRAGSANAAACSVAPASFETLVDPILGSGNYFAQRLYRYQPGELVAPEVPDLRVERLHPRARLQRWPSDPERM